MSKNIKRKVRIHPKKYLKFKIKQGIVGAAIHQSSSKTGNTTDRCVPVVPLFSTSVFVHRTRLVKSLTNKIIDIEKSTFLFQNKAQFTTTEIKSDTSVTMNGSFPIQYVTTVKIVGQCKKDFKAVICNVMFV